MKLTLLFLMTTLLTLEAEEITKRLPQIDNEHVKVWKTEIAPNQPLKMHRHDVPRIVIGLKGGVLKKIEQTGDISDLVFETGQAYWFDADPEETLYTEMNASDETIEIMVIEFKEQPRHAKRPLIHLPDVAEK